MSFKKISRRALLALGLSTAAVLVLPGRRGALAALRPCPDPTPQQVPGPFYPTRRGADEDFDLTRIEGHEGKAAGESIHVRGRVLDEACRPIPGARVEIWQANTWGRYNHERDAGNPRPLDPNFQGWARIEADADGGYGFKTIKPGPYPAGAEGWVRPPHIHFRVFADGFRELVTQMYFAGEPLNEPDLIRKALSAAERERVTVTLRPSESRIRSGRFDIVLQRLA